MGSSANMAKLLILALLFCVACAAATPQDPVEDEPQSSPITFEDEDMDLDDEPRSLEMEDGVDVDGAEELDRALDELEQAAMKDTALGLEEDPHAVVWAKMQGAMDRD